LTNQFPFIGLYRIPASSTTCGLINSGNGPPTPGSSLVTTPLNPGLFTNWTSSGSNPPQGQFLRANPPRLPPHPPPNRVNPTIPSLMNGESTTSHVSNSGTSATTTNSASPGLLLSLNQDRLIVTASSITTTNSNSNNNCTTNSNIINTRPVVGPLSSSSIPLSSSATISSQLQRHLSLLQQHNPSLLRSICAASNGTGNNGPSHHRSSRAHCDTLPTIYTTGSRSNPGGGATGTMNSIINSVTNSSTSGSNNSLPPPYFLEQYRIRNRVRQPRNVAPAVLLPSYNEIQREEVSLSRNGVGSCSSGTRRDSRRTANSTNANVTIMNDLSAPPRHNNHERMGRSRANSNSNNHYQEIQQRSIQEANLSAILNCAPPNPKRLQNNNDDDSSSLLEGPSRDSKILNTVPTAVVQSKRVYLNSREDIV
jgi:hypothetical protein